MFLLVDIFVLILLVSCVTRGVTRGGSKSIFGVISFLITWGLFWLLKEPITLLINSIPGLPGISGAGFYGKLLVFILIYVLARFLTKCIIRFINAVMGLPFLRLINSGLGGVIGLFYGCVAVWLFLLLVIVLKQNNSFFADVWRGVTESTVAIFFANNNPFDMLL